MKKLIQPLLGLTPKERFSKKGQTLVEYALILATISVVGILVFGLLSSRIAYVFSAMTLIIDTAQSSS